MDWVGLGGAIAGLLGGAWGAIKSRKAKAIEAGVELGITAAVDRMMESYERDMRKLGASKTLNELSAKREEAIAVGRQAAVIRSRKKK